MCRNKRGQQVIEFVLLLSIIIAALLILGYYIRNSLSGRLRETADVFGHGDQYIPSVSHPYVDTGAKPTNVTENVNNQ